MAQNELGLRQKLQEVVQHVEGGDCDPDEFENLLANILRFEPDSESEKVNIFLSQHLLDIVNYFFPEESVALRHIEAAVASNKSLLDSLYFLVRFPVLTKRDLDDLTRKEIEVYREATEASLKEELNANPMQWDIVVERLAKRRANGSQAPSIVIDFVENTENWTFTKGGEKYLSDQLVINILISESLDVFKELMAKDQQDALRGFGRASYGFLKTAIKNALKARASS